MIGFSENEIVFIHGDIEEKSEGPYGYLLLGLIYDLPDDEFDSFIETTLTRRH